MFLKKAHFRSVLWRHAIFVFTTIHQFTYNNVPQTRFMSDFIDYMSTAQLDHKQLETHGCVLSRVANDALVKNQAISTHRAYIIPFISNQFHREMLHL